MILVIDNYDSFVFNLARYVEELGFKVLVKRNDAITLAEIRTLNPTHILLSPGPCGPQDAGLSMEIVKEFAGRIPILGICLGHQVIGCVFEAEVLKAKKPMHGKASLITHNARGIFTNIPSPFTVGRYHSLIVSGAKLNKAFAVSALSFENEIMAISSKQWQVVGLQFHPESVLTEYGHQLLSNFLAGIF